MAEYFLGERKKPLFEANMLNSMPSKVGVAELT
jgi:hypothetical protein